MYKKEEILHKVGVQIHHIDQLYKARFVNYKGRTTDTKELYTEVIAEEKGIPAGYCYFPD